MNDLERLDHLFEKHSCSNCSQEIWCEDGQGVCEKWQGFGEEFFKSLEKIKNEINKNIKRGGVIWTA